MELRICLVFVILNICEEVTADLTVQQQFDSEIVSKELQSPFEKAFKRGEDELIAYKYQKFNLQKQGVDKFDEFSIEGAEDIFNVESEAAKKLEDRALVFLTALKSLKADNISMSDFAQREDLVEIWRYKAKDYCPCTEKNAVACNPKARYRTADGSCNNLLRPEWGKSETPHSRFLAPVYGDGIDSPRTDSVTGRKLPSARKVSNIALNCDHEIHSDKFSVLFMAWGQFLDHDITATPQSKGANGSSIQCCGIPEKREECFPIIVPRNDPHFRETCLNFVRSAGSVNLDACDTPSPRQQLNEITSYIDASNVYGSSSEAMDNLRSFVDGELLTAKNNLLPKGENHTCRLTNKNEFCMFAGDGRVNEVPNLSFMHTLFVREHNRIAKKLHKLNSFWDDEKVFQETRKIVSGYMQQISYTEYLPNILNKATLYQNNLGSSADGFTYTYNNTVNPSIRNAFATAAYRFGHSQIPSLQAYFRSTSNIIDYFKLEDTFFNPHTIQFRNGKHIPDIGRWLAFNTSMEMDRCFVDGIRINLFKDKDNRSLDLPALNIQRGRDHGIPPYVEWRKWCGLSDVSSFGVGEGGLVDHIKKSALLLNKAYDDVRDIDLFAGGITEKHLPGAILGPTFSCIIGRQFHHLKHGDRFWYESADRITGFTEGQLKALREVKLSKILCENAKINKIQKDVFQIYDSSCNKIQRCADLPDLDIQQWRVERPFN